MAVARLQFVTLEKTDARHGFEGFWKSGFFDGIGKARREIVDVSQESRFSVIRAFISKNMSGNS